MLQHKKISGMTKFSASPEESLLLIIRKGEGKYDCAPHISEFLACDVFFIPPKDTITLTPEHFTTCELSLLTFPSSWVRLYSQDYYICETFQALLNASRNTIHLRLTYDDFTSVSQYFLILEQQCSENRLHGQLIARHLITALLLQLSRYYGSQCCMDTKYKKSRKRLTIEKAKYFIEQNYSDPLPLQSLSESLQISPSYLSRLFKQSTGIGLSDYINQVRIEHSQLFLIDTDELIIDIAVACGFNYTAQFNSTFKKLVGMSPGQYRKEKRPKPL